MKKVSVIIIARNDELTLKPVIRSVRTLNPLEVIVIACGSTDGSVAIAKEEQCIVKINGKQKSLHEARIQAACVSEGDVLLFLDGDYVISHSELERFMQPLLFGNCDVVLNKWDERFTHLFGRLEAMWSAVLHDLLKKSHATNANIRAPYAFTREVLIEQEKASFSHPIYLFKSLQENGWRISTHMEVHTFGRGTFKPFSQHNDDQQLSLIYEKIIQEMVRGKKEPMEEKSLLDEILARKETWNVVEHGWGKLSSFYDGKQLSIVIPVQNEEKTIKDVISEARKLEPLEIIVIINGSKDRSEQYAREMEVRTIVFEQSLGHDAGRSIGAAEAAGDILLFIDGDFVISAHDLYPFAKAIAKGADVALNKSEDEQKLSHIVQAWKYVLNAISNRIDLQMSSLTAVPHAISQSCVKKIGCQSLSVPPVAQVKALQNQCQIEAVHYVDVNKKNRFRLEHLALDCYGATASRIIENHIQAFLLAKDEQE
ncbi:glycosyltransferase family 2 protein [Priestia megaterium]|nr:glycosyltransferase family 2 protein [Priestia megaterium]